MANNHFNFEVALQNLNDIVTQMEQGGLSLEDSLRQFEKGIALTLECQKALQNAEQKVQILMEKNSELTLDNYQSEE